MIDRGSKVDTEVLDFGFGFGIDYGAGQSLIGNLQIGLKQQWRELKRVLVIDESIAGNGIGRKDLR